jgi:hypothetical protein
MEKMGGGSTRRQTPSLNRPLRVKADSLEDEKREAHQGASPERDENASL